MSLILLKYKTDPASFASSKLTPEELKESRSICLLAVPYASTKTQVVSKALNHL